MTKPAELTEYVFTGQVHPLSRQLRQWLDASPRFTTFVETYRDKIRKKIRVTRQPESITDLRGELAVAYYLLNDRRLSLAYEPYASAKGRGPDFAVTYRSNLVFNVEVSRIRAEASSENGSSPPRGEDRLLRTMLAKLGQMQPGMPNLLVIPTSEALVQAIDLAGLMQEFKFRVERKEPAFMAAIRYPDPAAFYKDFSHLSGILLWAANGQPEPSGCELWTNRQARPGLDEKVSRLVNALLAGTPSPT